MYSESGLYFVTARAFQSRHLLKPSRELNDVVGGVLARAVALHGVELHGFVVLSNHLHLLVTARGAILSGFMQYVLGNIARKVGRLRTWPCALWERRFSAEPVLDDAAADERLAYILSNGVKEGLVSQTEDWHGLTCLRQLREDAAATFRFFHWARRWEKGELREGGDDLLSSQWAEEVSLRLTPLPSWRALTADQRRMRVDELAKDIAESGTREAPPAPLLSEAEACAKSHHRPETTAKSPRPLCHSSSRQLRGDYRDSHALWNCAYMDASAKFRAGQVLVEFPPWAFKPSAPPLTDLYKVCGT
jgi:REP element-mobilizing transposase RayT